MQSFDSICELTYIHYRAKEHLGSGQFGTVERGLWRRDGKAMEVAIKTLKVPAMANGPSRLKLLQEAVIMAQFQHPNVLFLCGVAGQGETVRILLHFCSAKCMHVTIFRSCW